MGWTMRLALFQPDIPTNSGTMLRMAACLGVAADIIEPCGFPVSDKSLRRALMDYARHLDLKLHGDWESFDADRKTTGRRLVLIETGAAVPYTDFAYAITDTLMVGRETAGTPPHVIGGCDAVVHIPMRPGLRSLNVAIAAAMVLGEALRQLRAAAV